MADHMTAEQLRAELRKISQWARDANSAPTPMGNSLVHVANSIDQLGARLSGIEQLLADREVAIAQAVEFAEYVEQAAKGKMAERAAHFLSAPYAAELRSRLSGMAAVPTWQPIGTAPKDDQWILGWRAHDVKPLIVRFDPLFDEFEDESGTHIYHLTYWHSLPAAPEVPGHG